MSLDGVCCRYLGSTARPKKYVVTVLIVTAHYSKQCCCNAMFAQIRSGIIRSPFSLKPFALLDALTWTSLMPVGEVKSATAHHVEIMLYSTSYIGSNAAYQLVCLHPVS